MSRITRKQKKSLLANAAHLVTDFTDKKLGNFAASTAFFFFISLIPMCILLSTLLPLTGLDKQLFEELVTAYIPPVVEGLVQSIIEDAFSSSTKVFSLSILAIFYASGRGMIALMQGLNVVYGIREHRSYPRIVLVAVIYMFLLLAFIIGSLILGVFGENIYHFVGSHVPHMEHVMAEILGLRALVIFGSAIVLFSLMYTYTPARNQ